jgi:hypothetical protein
MEASGLPISWDTPAARRPMPASFVAVKSSSSIFFFSVMSSNTSTYPFRTPVSRLTRPVRTSPGSNFRRHVNSPSRIWGVKTFGSRQVSSRSAGLPRASDFSVPVIISMALFQ